MRLNFYLTRVFIVCLFSSLTVSAVNISLGVKGGLNIASWRGGNLQNNVTVVSGIPEDKKFKAGWCAGLRVGIKFIDYFALQPEIGYSMKGFKQVYKIQVMEGNKMVEKKKTMYLNVNYFEIPILLKALFPTGKMAPNIYTGLALAIRMKIKGYTVLDGNKTAFTGDENFAYNNHINIFDFGIAMGGGVTIKAGPGDFILDVRYTLGIRKLWFGANTNYPKEKNNVFSFITGYAFNF